MFTQKLVQTDRGQFEVFVRGEEELLAFTHLYSEFNENGDIMSQHLSGHYKVYIINLRGAGKTDDRTEKYTYSMDDAIYDIESVRQELNIEKWTFAGHSTGGFLALKYAVMYPKKLTKIIAGGLCASGEYMDHPDSIYCKDNPNNKRMLEIFEEMRLPGTTREQRIELAKEWTMMSLYREEVYYDMLTRKMNGRTLVHKIDYFTSELSDYDVREQLKTSPVRAYIYCGRHDAQCPHVFSEETVNLMPNGTLETFEYSNHNPDIEEEEKFKKFLAGTI